MDNPVSMLQGAAPVNAGETIAALARLGVVV